MPIDSSSPNDHSAFAEFLSEYFVECDEHLSIARRSVLALEQQSPQASVDRRVLDELFRSFHSLKGLSAMVGFEEAEQLAHHLEAFLGAIRRGEIQLELVGLESLIEGVGILERIIAARRDAQSSPNIAHISARLARLIPQSGSAPSVKSQKPADKPIAATADKDALIAAKISQGAQAWQITFTPSAALVARGVDINAVRQQLQSLGEIVHSAPVIADGGRIEFLFVLISSATEQELSVLQSDGLTCEPYSPRVEEVTAPAIETPMSPSIAEKGSTHLTPANIVRVDLNRLDELMRLVGELVLTRARLEEGVQQLQGFAPPAKVRALRETAGSIERQLRDLREAVMRVRMVPVREVFARMHFVVRDLTREVGKQVSLKLIGEETQIDKYIVERIMDPLLHLVRNAVSHGLESSDARLAAGKSVEGKLSLSARATGETVVIEVEDDGRGIDAEQVIAQAHKRGLESLLPLETASLLDILCVPGFSTRDSSDRVSGRGIGMDVVGKAVEDLGGSLTLHTFVGRGTRFEIRLPLTLAITDALIVKSGSERFAVPQVAVREIISLEAGSSTFIESNELLNYRNGALPLLRLSRHFGSTSRSVDERFALVIGEGVQGLAIVVDRVLGLREIVVRPLTDRLVQVPGISGATELGDGRAVLILDPAAMLRGIRKRGGAIAQTPLSQPETKYVS